MCASVRPFANAPVIAFFSEMCVYVRFFLSCFLSTSANLAHFSIWKAKYTQKRSVWSLQLMQRSQHQHQHQPKINGASLDQQLNAVNSLATTASRDILGICQSWIIWLFVAAVCKLIYINDSFNGTVAVY